MTAIAEHVLKDALNLSPIERAELIERLFQSFDCSMDHHIDSAWKTEVESRINAYDRGEIEASPRRERF